MVVTSENDRQVPLINGHQKSNGNEMLSFPVIIQSNNLLIDNERQPSNNNNNQLNDDDDDDDDDIEEIEISSDDDDDDNHHQTTIQHVSNIDEPVTNSNLMDDQDDSTYMSSEQVETNQSSSNIPPVPVEISNSNDRDLYEHVSSNGISNPSTFDTRLSTDERATSR